MKMRKVVMAALVAGSVASSSVFADDADRINKLIIQMKVMQDEIKSLRKNLKSNEVAVKEVKESGKSNIKLGKLVDQLKIKGDFRVKYERDNKTSNDDDGNLDSKQHNDNYELRMRLGAEWKAENDFTFGTRVKFCEDAGLYDDEERSFFVDRAYVKYTGFEDTNIIAGRMAYPLEENGMIWDTDYSPEGVGVQYDNGSLFVNAMAAAIANDQKDKYQQQSDGTNSNWIAVQAGLKNETDDLSFMAGVGFYYPTGQTVNQQITEAEGINNDYDMAIGELFANVEVKLDKKMCVNAHAKVVKNLKASGDSEDSFGSRVTQIEYFDETQSASDNSMGYEVGFGMKYDKLSVEYAYRHLEGDATWGEVADEDLNRKAHVFGAKYRLAKNWSLSGEYSMQTMIEKEKGTSSEKENCLDMALAWKF